MIHLAIDTATMRRHLFGGWAFLTFLAARAREGRLQIYLPWVTHHETLTGIRDHVEDLTARKKLDTGLAEIAKGQADKSPLSDFQLAAQRARERIYADTTSKYQGWIASSQAEILPLTIQQSQAAWDAYFAGAPPFRSAKNRADLPDGFALQALLELAAKVGPIHFIVGDGPFREACSRYTQIVCHADVYSFCASQGIAIDVSSEKQLQKRKLPLAELESNAGTMLQRKLAGLALRVSADSDVPADQLRVEVVKDVGGLSLDPNSVIHVAEHEYLIAFSCCAVVQCHAEPPAAGARSTNYSAELRGHLLIRAVPDTTGDQLLSDLDSVEASAVTVAADQNVITVVRAPEFVTDRWFEQYVGRITAPGQSGLVVVAGSNQPTRRRVAEHLLRLRQRRDPDLSSLYFSNFAPEFSNTLLHVTSCSPGIGENDIFERAADTSAKALAISLEDDDWLAPALGFVIRENGFVIATMKRVTSVSAVVRDLYRDEKDIALEKLLGVAIVKGATAEQINFRAVTYGEWGDGSWWGILEHDAFVSRYRS